MKTLPIAAAVLVLSLPARAEIFKNLKAGGEIDLQTTAAQNTADFATRPVPGGAANNDRVGGAQTLILVRADWDALDDVHARLTLGKNDRSWGTQGGDTTYGHNGTGAQQSQPVGAAGGKDVLGNVFVDEAFLKIDKVFGAVDTTFGRQFYGTQGDIAAYYGPRVGVLGMPVTSLDAMRLDWTNETLTLTGIVGKTVGSAVETKDNADSDLRGLLGTYRFDDSTSIGAYLYNAVIHGTGASGLSGVGSAAGINTFLYLAGIRGKLAWGPLVARAEAAKDMGQDRTGAVTSAGSTYTGWAGKLDVGLHADFEDLGSAGLWAQVAAGSGQGDAVSKHNNLFTPIAGDYRAGDIYTRFNSLSAIPLGSSIASSSLGNRVIAGVGLKGTPAAATKLTAGIGYWDYHYQTSPLTANGGAATAHGNKHLGSEADLDLDWKHSENVSFDAGAGKFFPGGVVYENHALTPGLGVNAAWAAWLDVHVQF